MRPFPSALPEDFGWFMVHYLWMGAAVGFLGFLVRFAWPSASPKARYALSLFVFSALVLLGAALAIVMFSPWELWRISLVLPSIVLPDWFLQSVPMLPAVWGGVGGLLLVLLALGLVGTWRLRLATSPVPERIQRMADRLMERWPSSRAISVRICQRIGEPILLGICRPLILLPPAVLLKCRPEQLELILLHELAHIRRRDNLVLLVQRTAEVVFWFQPAVWMVSRWITRDREFCCDQFVLKQTPDRKLYAETLVTLAGLAWPKRSPLLVAFFGREHVFARIRYILNSEESAMSRSRSLAQAAVLSLAAVLGMLAIHSPDSQAVADPPIPAVKSVVPVETIAPPTPVVPTPKVAPAPVIIPPVPPVPSSYTQKPEVIIELAPESEQQPQPQAGLVPASEVIVLEAQAAQPGAKRAWGPEQAEGAPDTEGAGDIQTAWASQTQDAQKEWLICEYAEAVLPRAVIVHETYNPGSLEKVTVFDEAGTEHMAWTGTDPTPRTAARGTSIIPIKTKFKIQKVKLFFDSPAVPGWNEIDAIGLRSDDNEVQWAQKVTASSTYAQQQPEPVPVPVTVTVPVNQLKQLEEEVKSLKTEMQRLKQMEADIKELKELIKSLKEE